MYMTQTPSIMYFFRPITMKAFILVACLLATVSATYYKGGFGLGALGGWGGLGMGLHKPMFSKMGLGFGGYGLGLGYPGLGFGGLGYPGMGFGGLWGGYGGLGLGGMGKRTYLFIL